MKMIWNVFSVTLSSPQPGGGHQCSKPGGSKPARLSRNQRGTMDSGDQSRAVRCQCSHEYNLSPPGAALSFQPFNLPSRATGTKIRRMSQINRVLLMLCTGLHITWLFLGHPAVSRENKTNLPLQTSARMSLTLDIIQTGKQNKALQLPLVANL